jgi:hypothetical protein
MFIESQFFNACSVDRLFIHIDIKIGCTVMCHSVEQLRQVKILGFYGEVLMLFREEFLKKIDKVVTILR